MLALVPVHVAAWLLRVLVVAPLWVIGIPLCYVLARRHAWEIRDSRFFVYDGTSTPRKLAQWRVRWVWLIYGNDEDGVAGPRSFMQGAPPWKRALVWSAWRNPVNNLRFVWPFGIQIDPPRVRVRGNTVLSPDEDEAQEFEAAEFEDREPVRRVLWSYTWQGPFAGLWIRWPRGARAHGQFRIGWKLIPRDARGVYDADYRSKGCPFGLQFHWHRGA
jgi:hypothetical protein